MKSRFYLNWKSFVCGIVITIVLTIGLAVFASGIIKEAYFNSKINLIVDGNKLDSEVVTVVLEGNINGSNYVPVRGLVEAMGGTVSYDSKTSTITVVTSGSAIVGTSPLSQPVQTVTSSAIVNTPEAIITTINTTGTIPDQSLIPTEVKNVDVIKNLTSNDVEIQEDYQIGSAIKYNNIVYIKTNSFGLNTNYQFNIITIDNVKTMQIYNRINGVLKIYKQQVLQIDDVIIVTGEPATDLSGKLRSYSYVKYDLVSEFMGE